MVIHNAVMDVHKVVVVGGGGGGGGRFIKMSSG